MPLGQRQAKVVVGSGWWSAGIRSKWNKGDDLTRSPAFFALWHRQVLKSLDPSVILVTDSSSPNKPEWQRFDRVRWLELDRNYGHANDIRIGLSKTKFAGHTRAELMGALYALCCDADYFVYVEQDCLLKGEDFLAQAIGDQEFDFFCGQRTVGGRSFDGGIAAPMLQESVLVMNRRGIENFLSRIIAVPYSDGDLSPEVRIEKELVPYGLLQVPYGRSRPIDFCRSHFYVQHLTREELLGFLQAERLTFSDWFAAS